jgi:hypothetical protein
VASICGSQPTSPPFAKEFALGFSTAVLDVLHETVNAKRITNDDINFFIIFYFKLKA